MLTQIPKLNTTTLFLHNTQYTIHTPILYEVVTYNNYKY